jgi:hypothetical protein
MGLARLDMATTSMCRRAGVHVELVVTLSVELRDKDKSVSGGRANAGREKGRKTSALTGSACVCLPRAAEAAREGVTHRTHALLDITREVGFSLLVGETAVVGDRGRLLGGGVDRDSRRRI